MATKSNNVQMSKKEFERQKDFWTKQGKISGRAELAQELMTLLNIDSIIYNAIEEHENRYQHDLSGYY